MQAKTAYVRGEVSQEKVRSFLRNSAGYTALIPIESDSQYHYFSVDGYDGERTLVRVDRKSASDGLCNVYEYRGADHETLWEWMDDIHVLEVLHAS